MVDRRARRINILVMFEAMHLAVEKLTQQPYLLLLIGGVIVLNPTNKFWLMHL